MQPYNLEMSRRGAILNAISESGRTLILALGRAFKVGVIPALLMALMAAPFHLHPALIALLGIPYGVICAAVEWKLNPNRDDPPAWRRILDRTPIALFISWWFAVSIFEFVPRIQGWLGWRASTESPSIPMWRFPHEPTEWLIAGVSFCAAVTDERKAWMAIRGFLAGAAFVALPAFWLWLSLENGSVRALAMLQAWTIPASGIGLSIVALCFALIREKSRFWRLVREALLGFTALGCAVGVVHTHHLIQRMERSVAWCSFVHRDRAAGIWKDSVLLCNNRGGIALRSSDGILSRIDTGDQAPWLALSGSLRLAKRLAPNTRYAADTGSLWVLQGLPGQAPRSYRMIEVRKDGAIVRHALQTSLSGMVYFAPFVQEPMLQRDHSFVMVNSDGSLGAWVNDDRYDYPRKLAYDSGQAIRLNKKQDGFTFIPEAGEPEVTCPLPGKADCCSYPDTFGEWLPDWMNERRYQNQKGRLFACDRTGAVSEPWPAVQSVKGRMPLYRDGERAVWWAGDTLLVMTRTEGTLAPIPLPEFKDDSAPEIIETYLYPEDRIIGMNDREIWLYFYHSIHRFNWRDRKIVSREKLPALPGLYQNKVFLPVESGYYYQADLELYFHRWDANQFVKVDWP